jgi:hypothetical protein
VLCGTISGGPCARANAAAVVQPSFTDTGRAPDTGYSYVVESIGSGGARSAPSNEVFGPDGARAGVRDGEQS